MAAAALDPDTMSGRIERLPLSKLTTGRYQRDLNASFVTRIAHEWDEHRAGVLTVSHRNGRNFLIDGQHRHAAAKSIGVEDLPCQIWEGLSEADEAQYFVGQIQRRPLKPYDRHKSRLVYKDKEAVSVEAAVREAGCQLRTGASSPDAVGAVNGVYNLHAMTGPTIVTQTLELLRRAWPLEKPSQRWATDLVVGVGVFLAAYPKADIPHLLSRLNEVSPRDVQRLAMDKRGGSHGGGFTYRENVLALLSVYNRGNQKKLLTHGLDEFAKQRRVGAKRNAGAS